MERGYSVQKQEALLRRLGYNLSNWDPNNKEEADKVFRMALNAQLKGVDAQQQRLSADDLALLSVLTGRK